MAGRVLLLADVYPALSMPQADAGNLRVLEQRAAARGIAVRSVTVQPGDPLPAADLYQVAGAADEDLPELARRLADRGNAGRGRGRRRRPPRDRRWLPGGRPDLRGSRRPASTTASGLLDVRSSRGSFVDGPVVGTPAFAPGLPELAGFESHCGRIDPGPGCRAVRAPRGGDRQRGRAGHGRSGGRPRHRDLRPRPAPGLEPGPGRPPPRACSWARRWRPSPTSPASPPRSGPAGWRRHGRRSTTRRR